MKKYIAYYRVSTKDQHYGLEAQRLAVKNFLKDGSAISAEFYEKESGKDDDRPELHKALTECKFRRATLVISKLDRLSRNASFIFKLRDSGVDFVCADMPEANTLTIGIFAAVAQHERELISSRTKAGLAVAKSIGVILGSPQNLTIEARKKGNDVMRSKRVNNTEFQKALSLAKLMRSGGSTMQVIADELNRLGYKTAWGRTFECKHVSQLLK